MIKKYRLKNKMSQEELAEEIGISWRQLQRLEHNEENTRVSTFKKIIKVLNVPDDEILRFIKNEQEVLMFIHKTSCFYFD